MAKAIPEDKINSSVRNWHLIKHRLPGFTGPVPPPLLISIIYFVYIVSHIAQKIK